MIVLLNELISTIRSDQEGRRRKSATDPFLTHLSDTQSLKPEQSTSHLGGEYVWTQLLLDCLSRMTPSSDERRELIDLCRKFYQGNEIELANVDQFEKHYQANRALWWYTKESFVYRLLNKALRTCNIDLLYAFRFFIRDLDQQLQIHRCLSRLELYRCQWMSMDEILILQKSVDQFIAVNAYFSTSLDQEVAMEFFVESTDLQRVLFIIEADANRKDIKAFANIKANSYYPEEDEVLFQMGTVFQLRSVKHKINDDLWVMRVVLVDNGIHDSAAIIKQLKSEQGTNDANLVTFADVIRRLGKYDQAEKYYRRFLQSPTDTTLIPDCYDALATIESARKNYQSSLNYYEDALAMRLARLGPNDPKVATSYHHLGMFHRKQGDYPKAVDSYKKALTIWTAAHGRNHPKVATCLTNIGSVYEHQKQNEQALDYYKQSLTIGENLVPIDYHTLSITHNNLGNLYSMQEDYKTALEHYERSLTFKSKILPSYHRSIGTVCHRLGEVYEKLGSTKEAEHYYHRAAEINQHPPQT